MKKVLLHLVLVLCSVATIMVSRAEASDEPVASGEAVVQELISIQNKYKLSKENLYYFEINVMEASMDVYRLVPAKNGNFSLEFISSHQVGTPKVREYPHGFGIITKVEHNPIWAPTPATVKEFQKRGIDLAKFKNKEGKIIVPAGNPLNYMGPIKMRISFVTPQKSPKTRREVYRIHDILPQYKKKLGTRCSGGCTRVDNEEIKELARMTRKSSIIIQYI